MTKLTIPDEFVLELANNRYYESEGTDESTSKEMW